MFKIICFLVFSLARAEVAPLTVVIQGATWCSGCRELEKSLIQKKVISSIKELKKPEVPPLHFTTQVSGVETPIEVRIFQVDLMSEAQKDENFKKYGVSIGLPTVTIFRDGKKILRRVGMRDFDDISLFLSDEHLQSVLEAKDPSEVESSYADPRVVDSVRRRVHGFKSAALVYASSAGRESNGASIANTLSLVQENLIGAGVVNPANMLSFYGLGPGQTTEAEIRPAEGKKLAVFAPRSLKYVDFAANQPNLISTATALREEGLKKLLIIIKGHGGLDGLASWPNDHILSQTFRDIVDFSQANTTVMINGTCHSGIFQRIGQCGFYAARPELESTGCGTSEFKKPDEFVGQFMAALDKNRDATFAEAYWRVYNSTDGDTTYTDIDALADLAGRAARFSKEFSMIDAKKARELFGYLNPQEQAAFKKAWDSFHFKKGTVLKSVNLGLDFNDTDKNSLASALGQQPDLPIFPPANHLRYADGRRTTRTKGEDAYKVRRFVQLLRRGVLRKVAEQNEILSRLLKIKDSCEAQSIRAFMN